MADSKTFPNVTPAVFDCVKKTSATEHGTVYSPPDADSGTATTSGTGWKVVLSFDLDTTTGDLTYTVVSKTWIVPISRVWSGIGDTITSCQGTAE